MPLDAIKQFVSLRDSLLKERSEIRNRLDDINKALGGESPIAFEKPAGSEVAFPFGEQQEVSARRRRRRRMSPEARARIAEAARKRWAKAKAAGKKTL